MRLLVDANDPFEVSVRKNGWSLTPNTKTISIRLRYHTAALHHPGWSRSLPHFRCYLFLGRTSPFFFHHNLLITKRMQSWLPSFPAQRSKESEKIRISCRQMLLRLLAQRLTRNRKRRVRDLLWSLYKSTSMNVSTYAEVAFAVGISVICNDLTIATWPLDEKARRTMMTLAMIPSGSAPPAVLCLTNIELKQWLNLCKTTRS